MIAATGVIVVDAGAAGVFAAGNSAHGPGGRGRRGAGAAGAVPDLLRGARGRAGSRARVRVRGRHIPPRDVPTSSCRLGAVAS